ncbi:WXG100 family type VII secretion target [Nocardia albiluteola]|uniref:WXG100 family type VII secretion target n=1 Tax=Nocardia albiluteola TaxID=2842303 RepID=UPI001FDAB600|nr:WXG100 family type VII secretion target [Nocardia albiluteola]
MSGVGGDPELTVVPDDVVALGKYAHELAGELRSALAEAGRQVQTVTEKGWTGTASAGFLSGWSECQDGGDKIIDALTTMASTLGFTAQAYTRQDDQFADHLSSLDLP